MNVIKIWFAASAVIVATLFLYHFAPIVLFLLAVTALLGAITVLVVSIARALHRRWSRNHNTRRQ
jgi:hypothetical protein